MRTLSLATLALLAASQPPDTTARAVDRLFDAWRDTQNPGCVVGVSRGGRVLYERGYGMADIEAGTPMRPSTVVHAASLAKQFTAMSVLLLARDGKLSLDDEVHKYLPELPDYGAPITIRHLLGHTSGLRDFFELLIIARGRFEEDRITRADALDVVTRQRALNFAPGTQYAYTNTGYLLAAEIVRRVSGRPLSAFAKERIFEPLGMTSTRIRDSFTALVPGRAQGYARAGDGWRSSAPNYDVNGPTNLLTTVGDLLRWADNLEHPVVGDSAIVRQMSTSGVLANGDSTNYGLGLALLRDRGTVVTEHEGGDPGFHAYFGRWPAQGLAVALLCNAPVNSVALGRSVAAVYLGPTAPDPTPVAAPVVDRTVDVARFAGVYFMPTYPDVVELTMRDGRLYTARNGGLELVPVDAHRLRLVGRPLDIVFGAGAHPGYREEWLVPGRRGLTYEWRAAAQPALDRAALAAYAGEYASAELDATYRVTANDSTLTLRAGTSDGFVARPVFADTFVSGQYVVEFTRTGSRVTGFRISHPRARRVTFVPK